MYKTGGGLPPPTDLTEFDARVVGTFEDQFLPLADSCDDDASYMHIMTLPYDVRILCLRYWVLCSIFVLMPSAEQNSPSRKISHFS